MTVICPFPKMTHNGPLSRKIILSRMSQIEQFCVDYYFGGEEGNKGIEMMGDLLDLKEKRCVDIIKQAVINLL